jgi:hypothetical protein
MSEQHQAGGEAARKDEPRLQAPAAIGGDHPQPPPSPRARLTPRGPVGTLFRAAGPHGAQLVRTRGHRWSDEAEEIFLDALALTCNGAYAAEQAGFSANTVYRRRRKDPVFAAKWRDARQQGVARLDLLLIRAAEAALEGRAPDAESPFPKMSVADAIAIVRMYREEEGEGGRRRREWHARPRELDEVRASILRKLDAIERAAAPHAKGEAPEAEPPEGDGGPKAA